ncbi:hypothetical protein Val02_71330 [Virgisporangium aliadipatigenens]|uniref:Transcriptional regulator SbtR-like C-terminal domain-containing protein n=1 Tax=Virgisporangium aliadipatigenens TaxID=741659 RepID=A0A8J4DVL6_9ACTN|nr:hypothetical protein [Virgisporangium aliadipatigenens]GIJ50247.1 hypothetical protein Val02_71330 [Virgisporangium aliadipatigenens]
MIEQIDLDPACGGIGHPWWCDPRFCGGSHPLPCHLSAPYRVTGDHAGGVVITAQLSSLIDEPLELAPVSIETVIRDPVTGKAGRYLLEKDVALRFHALLGRLLPMVQRADALRDRILVAAESVFAAKGRDASTEQIARLAGALSRAGSDVMAAATRPDDPLHIALAQLLERAQRSGRVRPDVSVADLVASMVGVVHAMRHAGGATRVLTIVVDGLRPPATSRSRRRGSAAGRR